MTLVPAGSRLEARLYGPSRAIGFVRPGQRVLLRYEAFPHQKFGQYEGVVRSVSRSTVGPAELSGQGAPLPGLVPGEPVYRVTVELAAQTATAYGEAVPLQPGMQLEADVLIETRRLYQWVLDPLHSLTGRERGMNAADRLQFGWGRRLPVVLQTEAAECGLACLAMIAGYHGHHSDPTALRRRFGFSLKGATLKDLIGVADRIGLASRPVRLELDELGLLRTPCILHWDLNHFVVLKSVGRGGIVIHDPAEGVRKLPLEQASRHFTGVALELTPDRRLRAGGGAAAGAHPGAARARDRPAALARASAGPRPRHRGLRAARARSSSG